MGVGGVGETVAEVAGEAVGEVEGTEMLQSLRMVKAKARMK